MFGTFPDNFDEVCTRFKTPQSKTEQIHWMEQLSPPNAANAPKADRIAARLRLCPDQVDDQPPARSQRFESQLASQQSTQTQLPNFKALSTFPSFPQRNCPFPNLAPSNLVIRKF